MATPATLYMVPTNYATRFRLGIFVGSPIVTPGDLWKDALCFEFEKQREALGAFQTLSFLFREYRDRDNPKTAEYEWHDCWVYMRRFIHEHKHRFRYVREYDGVHIEPVVPKPFPV